MQQVINIIINFVPKKSSIIMFSILGNILAFVSTFVVIATLPMTLIRIAVVKISHSKQMKEQTEVIVIAISIAIAIMLIPFYHYPY